jgi:hypothetical protein
LGFAADFRCFFGAYFGFELAEHRVDVAFPGCQGLLFGGLGWG